MSSPSFYYRFAVILMLLGSTLLWAPAVQAGPYSALVVDTSSGKVLFEQNADAQRYPASLTKMMTLYITFTALKQGRLSLRQSLWVSPEACGVPAKEKNARLTSVREQGKIRACDKQAESQAQIDQTRAAWLAGFGAGGSLQLSSEVSQFC